MSADPHTSHAPDLLVLVEQIRNIVAKQAETSQQLSDLSNRLDQAYVPKGTYNAHREADDRRFRELERDRDSADGFRRQVAISLIVGFVMLLFSTIGTVAGLAMKFGG